MKRISIGRAFSLAMAVAVSLAATPSIASAQAREVAPRCEAVFAPRQRWNPRSALASTSEWMRERLSRPSALPGIDPEIARWIVANERSQGFTRPSRLVFKGRPLGVIARLGGGYEGEVFLVRASERFLVLKIFENKEHASARVALERQVRIFSDLNRHSVDTPRILDADETSLLMTYTEGIPVDRIRRSDPGLGLDPRSTFSRDRDRILLGYERFARDVRALDIPLLMIKDNNVVYSAKTDRFTVIDGI